MIAGMQRPKKLSARKLAHMNAEQAVVNLDMVKRNEQQQDRRKELENEIESMRETARRALEHPFSPHTWHKALVQIAAAGRRSGFMNMPTDKEMLDWLSGIRHASFERHYEPFVNRRTSEEVRTGGYNGHVDFFSIESQHLTNVPTLRDAIAQAMLKAENKTTYGEGTES